ncbi:hypothetical protein [Natronorarus salvus]
MDLVPLFAGVVGLGIGHPTSSIALVLAFFWVSSFTDTSDATCSGTR